MTDGSDANFHVQVLLRRNCRGTSCPARHLFQAVCFACRVVLWAFLSHAAHYLYAIVPRPCCTTYSFRLEERGEGYLRPPFQQRGPPSPRFSPASRHTFQHVLTPDKFEPNGSKSLFGLQNTYQLQ